MQKDPAAREHHYHQREHFSIVITRNATQAEHFEPTFASLADGQNGLVHFAASVVHDVLDDAFEYPA